MCGAAAVGGAGDARKQGQALPERPGIIPTPPPYCASDRGHVKDGARRTLAGLVGIWSIAPTPFGSGLTLSSA